MKLSGCFQGTILKSWSLLLQLKLTRLPVLKRWLLCSRIVNWISLLRTVGQCTFFVLFADIWKTKQWINWQKKLVDELIMKMILLYVSCSPNMRTPVSSWLYRGHLEKRNKDACVQIKIQSLIVVLVRSILVRYYLVTQQQAGVLLLW